MSLIRRSFALLLMICLGCAAQSAPPDLTRKIEWCASHDMSAFSIQNRTWAEATFSPEHLRGVWAEALEKNLFSASSPR